MPWGDTQIFIIKHKQVKQTDKGESGALPFSLQVVRLMASTLFPLYRMV